MKSIEKKVLPLILVSIILMSCQMEYVELKDIPTEALSATDAGMYSKEVIVEETINFDEILNPISEDYKSSIALSTDSNATDSELAVENEIIAVEESIASENEVTSEETSAGETMAETSENAVTEEVTSETVSEEETESAPVNDKVYVGELNLTTENWKYGKTPCEWVFVEPNTALISNYKPNSSSKYSIKSKVSSGSKGCYIPIFIETDMKGDGYDARFYVFEDYTKGLPDDMLFSNSLDSLTYEGKSIEEILKRSKKLSETKNGILVDGSKYINIVYVTDLDKILQSK